MPELPEVETTRAAISPFLLDKTISKIVTRHTQLRLPISQELQQSCGQTITAIQRRAKYLLIHLSNGYLLIHLGMSGHLRITGQNTPAGKHDHIDLELANGVILRYQDPRRFGLWLYIKDNPSQHFLLSHLGLEPLDDAFDADYLFKQAHKKTQCIKSFIMKNEIVVGVGNIYATESLFLAGIHPLTPAGMVPKIKLEALVSKIKKVLLQAITAGGTTLKDFYAVDGKPGYFANQLLVYGRKNQPCINCRTLIETVRIAGRSSSFCPNCQNMM